MAQAGPARRTGKAKATDGAGSGTSRSSATRRSTPAATAGPEPTLRIIETRVLRGPNYWAREPVIRLLVDLGVLEQYPSNTLPNFTDALVALLPTLEDHACSLGRRGGFITRLRDGTWMGHIAEHVALEFQNLAGTDVRHGKTRAAGPYGQYNCIFEYREEAVGLEAGRMAVALVNHLVAPDDPDVFFDFAPEMERLIRLAERQAFGPSTQALIDEAVSRDIPFFRLDRHSLVQFGHGVHQQRIRATMTSLTSAIGVDVASDKSLTNRLLDSAGLPVPRADVVDTEDGAVAVARRLGYPCVVKPLDGNHGRGVHLDLRSEAAVRAAFHGALAQSRAGDVVVESYVARQRLSLPGHRRQGRGHRRARPGVGDRRRHALGDGRDLAADDEAAIVVASNVPLDHHVARPALGQRAMERSADGGLRAQINGGRPGRGCRGLDHARVAEPPPHRHRAVSLSTTSARGPRPAESSSRLVRLLSDATSTPMAEVNEVIVAHPLLVDAINWTSHGNPANGMWQLTTSSMSASSRDHACTRRAPDGRVRVSGAKSKNISSERDGHPHPSSPTASSRCPKMQLYCPYEPAARVLPCRTSVPARFWNSSTTCSATWPVPLSIPEPRSSPHDARASSVGGPSAAARQAPSVKFRTAESCQTGIVAEHAQVNEQADDRLTAPGDPGPRRSSVSRTRSGGSRVRPSPVVLERRVADDRESGASVVGRLPLRLPVRRPVSAAAPSLFAADPSVSAPPVDGYGDVQAGARAGWDSRTNGVRYDAEIRASCTIRTKEIESGRRTVPMLRLRNPRQCNRAGRRHRGSPASKYDWQSPVWRHFLRSAGSLANMQSRYDERGFGCSWTVEEPARPTSRRSSAQRQGLKSGSPS